jgi:putative transposase
MGRFARVIVPGVPYHVTHRGNRRANVFVTHEERDVYCTILAEYASRYGMDIWAYCLMTNHVHLLVTGRERQSLANAIGRAHMRYARWFNRWHGWSGHLWANRYYSTPLDEAHLWTAVRYVEQNPVRAGLAIRCEEYAWSSTRANAGVAADALLSPARPFPGDVPDWLDWVNDPGDTHAEHRLRVNTSTGRPCGDCDFVSRIEQILNRSLQRQKSGRKPRGEPDGARMQDFFVEEAR